MLICPFVLEDGSWKAKWVTSQARSIPRRRGGAASVARVGGGSHLTSPSVFVATSATFAAVLRTIHYTYRLFGTYALNVGRNALHSIRTSGAFKIILCH